MNILSLFDGISCARMALGRSGISYEEYYASEIDKYALEISGKNFLKAPINLGDVRTINADCVKDVGLIIGGSPCQDLSISNKKRKGLSGSRSCLFWEFARLVKEVNPKYFLLENVASMPKEAKEIISKELGVEPIMINAALVSAQNRKRLFWTNIPNVTQPNDREIFLKDILLDDVDEKYFVKSNNWRIFRNLTPSDKKARCLNASAWKGAQNDGTTLVYVGRCGNKNIINDGTDGIRVRKLTPIECERLQSLPDDYTKGISDTQRYRCLGNAFNVDVVAHILSFIPKGDGFYAEERKNFDTGSIEKNEQSPVLHNGFCS